MSGAVNNVVPPVTVLVTFGFVLVRNNSFFPKALMLTGNVLLAENMFTAPSRYMSPPKPIFANRIFAAFAPCWPAL